MITALRPARWLWLVALALVCFPCRASTPNDLVYEIFVRSFADGTPDTDGNGNLKGITAKLDYLNDNDPGQGGDLEVGILWLMPVFPCTSYHGYDVTNFRAINPEYGTLDDFKELLTKAHEHGLRIILDIPFNHTSNRHPWFLEAVADASSSKRSWYHIEPGTAPNENEPVWHNVTAPNGTKLKYLARLGSTLPDLSFDNPDVRKEVKDIAAFWLNLGVDGFRLDAAKHIYGDTKGEPDEDQKLRNNDWWKEFSVAVYTLKPSAVLVGEVLGDREMFRRHTYGLDGLVEEKFMLEARDEIAQPSGGFIHKERTSFVDARDLNRSAYDAGLPFPDVPFNPFTFVASHDRDPRLATYFEDRRNGGMKPDVEQAYRTAIHLLLTVPGFPIIYQGDEVMQRGRKAGDPDYDKTLREPLPWNRAGTGSMKATWWVPRFDQDNDGVSVEDQSPFGGMVDLVRAISHLRAKHPCVANGEYDRILSDTGEWMVFEKVLGNERCLILINPTDHHNTYRFHAQWFPEYANAKVLFWSDGSAHTWKDESASPPAIQGSVLVPPYGLEILKKQ